MILCFTLVVCASLHVERACQEICVFHARCNVLLNKLLVGIHLKFMRCISRCFVVDGAHVLHSLSVFGARHVKFYWSCVSRRVVLDQPAHVLHVGIACHFPCATCHVLLVSVCWINDTLCWEALRTTRPWFFEIIFLPLTSLSWYALYHFSMSGVQRSHAANVAGRA